MFFEGRDTAVAAPRLAGAVAQGALAGCGTRRAVVAAPDTTRQRRVVSCRAAPGRRSKRVASKLPLSAVRPMGLTAAGGAERCRIETRADCLATFVDPATGEPRVACSYVKWVKCASMIRSRVVRRWLINVSASALTVFRDPATGGLRLVCGCYKGRYASSTRLLVARRCL